MAATQRPTQTARFDPHRMFQQRASLRQALQFDHAQEPLERPLRELAQHTRTLAFDPFEGMLFPGNIEARHPEIADFPQALFGITNGLVFD